MGASLSLRSSLTAVAVVGLLYLLQHRKAMQESLKVWIANKVVATTVKKLTAPGAVCEVTEKSVDGERYRVYKNAPKTLVEMVLEGRKHKDSDYLVHIGSRTFAPKRLTFKQFADEAARLGSILRDKFQVDVKENVVVLMANLTSHVVATIAASALGAVPTLCNAFWEAEEIETAILESDARVVILDVKRLVRLGSVLDNLANHGIRFICVGELNVAKDYIFSYEELLAATTPLRADEDPFDKLSKLSLGSTTPEDAALILYTSGTTSGKAKGVVLTHFAVTQAIESYNLFLEVMKALKGEPTIQRCDLVSSPLFHTAGLLSVFLAFRGGHKCVMFPKWNVDALVETMIKEKVTYFPSVPTMVVDMLNSERFLKNVPNFLFDNVGTGGAKIQPRLVHKVRDLFPGASQGTGWGMTETCAMGTVIGGPQFLKTPSSCGKPHAIVDVKVIDPDSLQDITTANTKGELCIRSPTMMKEYFKMPEETKASFLSGTRWYRTGDIGLFDKSGLFYIVDRIKDIVIRGGENISCTEVEHVISEFRNVDEVAVFGVPDSRLGERLIAYVVIGPKGRVEPGEIQQYVASRLAKFKVPSEIIISQRPLPRNALGKVVKIQLKKELAQ